MASIAEQIADAVFDALYNQIGAVGTRVFRAREDVIPRDECPAIVVTTLSEECEPANLSGSMEDCRLALGVSIHVVAEGASAVWETAADTIAVQAHALVRAASLPQTKFIARNTGSSWSSESADANAGVRTLAYEIHYTRSGNALDTAA